MSASVYVQEVVELPYPFDGSRIATFGTDGIIEYAGTCLICSNEHLVNEFFAKPWTSPTYRWDKYEDLSMMRCPSCGATVPNTFERRLNNFLKEMAYDYH